MNLVLPGALLAALLVPVPSLAPLSSPGPARVVHDSPAPAPGRAVWPLSPEPEITARFEPPTQTWGGGHRGVDLLGSRGSPVRAALGGTVSFAGTIAGRGVVVVDHGGFRTTYEPVLARVRRGRHVRAGAALGTLQSGRSHCAPRVCLHWGLVTPDGYRDPLGLIRTVRVRLLPIDEPQARG